MSVSKGAKKSKYAKVSPVMSIDKEYLEGISVESGSEKFTIDPRIHILMNWDDIQVYLTRYRDNKESLPTVAEAEIICDNIDAIDKIMDQHTGTCLSRNKTWIFWTCDEGQDNRTAMAFTVDGTFLQMPKRKDFVWFTVTR